MNDNKRSKAQRWVFMLLAVVMVMGALTGFTYPVEASASMKSAIQGKGPIPPISTCPYAGPCYPDPWPYPNPWPGDPFPWPDPYPYPDPFPWPDPYPYPPTRPIPMHDAGAIVQTVKSTAPGTIVFGSGREWGDEEHVACYLDCSFDYPEDSLDQNICLHRCDRKVNYPLPWHVMTQ